MMSVNKQNNIDYTNTEQNTDSLQQQVMELEAELKAAKIQLDALRTSTVQSRQYVQLAINTADTYANSKLVKLSVFLRSLRYQGMSRDSAVRKAFWHSVFKRTPMADQKYSPLAQVVQALQLCPLQIPAGVLTDADLSLPENRVRLQRRLSSPYTAYDVLIFGIIDYNSRYQRPQQIADHYAAEGHRVFYINSTFHNGSGYLIHEKKDHLFLVDLPHASAEAVYYDTPKGADCETVLALNDLLFNHGIRDGLIISEHPNWAYMLADLKQRTGFPLVTDYLDDFSGFDNISPEIVIPACRLLLESSDFVSASSLYLIEKAQQFTDRVELIRNGTEFNHFRTAFSPDTGKDRKVIGYYGAIAHWFDVSMIEYLSARFSSHDIILIGDVSAGEDRLKRLPNVQLLGEKPYAVLPEFLKDFDVCLIPFDASIDLIKATNPVKFYEYLSAGKKIVATEIPELEPFRNRFVYLANDPKQFGDYVEQCLNGTDTLASAEECMAFAKENDWSNRIRLFEECAQSGFPSVSVLLSEENEAQIQQIRSVTAYPNYTIVLPGQTIPETDYTAVLRPNAVVTRGWLTSLVQQLRKDNVGMVCAAVCSAEDIPAAAYLQAAKAASAECTARPETNGFMVKSPVALSDFTTAIDSCYAAVSAADRKVILVGNSLIAAKEN